MLLSAKHAQTEQPFYTYREGSKAKFYCNALLREIVGIVVAKQGAYVILEPASPEDWRYGTPTHYRLHQSKLRPVS
jgi:hypothetical protein